MATEWKAQIEGSKYSIQFETNHYDLYKMVKKACQKAVDIKDKRVLKERASTCSVIGHL